MTVREIQIITRLEALTANRAALTNLPERIEMLDNRLTAIKAATTDGDPVKGGSNRGEDMRIEHIIEKDLAEYDLEYAKTEVEQLDRALAMLQRNERTVLGRFFIYPTKDCVTRLCGELGYEEAQIYRIRKAAINNIANILYGSRRK